MRHARKLGLAANDISGLLNFLASPESAQFFGSGSSSEVDIRGNLPNGEKINRRVDRMVDLTAGVLLLDYKTGPRQTLSPTHNYVKQLAEYAWLSSTAKPGTVVKAALLWTQTGHLEWLSPELLSQAVDQIVNSPS